MNGFDLSTATDIRIGSTQASAVYIGSTKIWPVHDYSQDYFTIEALEHNVTIEIITGGDPNEDLYYSLSSHPNDYFWIPISNMLNRTAVLTTGQKLSFKGTGLNTQINSTTGVIQFVQTGSQAFKVYGNIMSLIRGDNFTTSTALYEIRQFESMFEDCDGLINAKDLILPATTLSSFCYSKMFQGCNYLTDAPALPATTLSGGCYNRMFYGCTSLANAPELPAPTLASYCYGYMFWGCSVLHNIKCLATDLTATDALADWVNSVPATGTFTKASSATWTTGTSGIPSGWTVQNA